MFSQGIISPEMYTAIDAPGKTAAVVIEYRVRLFQATYVSALIECLT